MKGYELRSGIESMAHKVCAALNLPQVRIRWVGIPTAAINARGEMYLANVADNATVNKQLINKYAGFVVHELLHRKYTDFNVRDGHAYIDRLHNAIEDAWIECNAISAGLTGNIETLLKTLADGLADQALADVSDWTDPAQYPFALALWARGFCKRVPIPANLVPVFDEAQRRVDTCLNTSDTLAVARWVFDQINQQSQQQQPQQQQPQQQPQKQEPDENGSESAPEGAQGDQSEGEGETEGGTENDSDQPTIPGNSKPVSADADSRTVEPQMQSDEGSSQRAFSNSDLRKPLFHCRDTKVHTIPAFNAGRLRFEVRKLFENSAFDDFAMNRKAGSLNVTALHRVKTSDKLFKRHQEHEGIDSAVIILIDCSGSMSRANRINVAIDTAAALYETLHKAGVAVSVMSFNDEVAVPVPFGTPIAKAKQTISKIIDGGGTADYEAIRHAHTILLNRPESRKVVFALTDGDGHPFEARKQIAIGESLGITTVGIGIQENIKRVYANSIQINNLSQLAEASFKQIKLAA